MVTLMTDLLTDLLTDLGTPSFGPLWRDPTCEVLASVVATNRILGRPAGAKTFWR